MEIKTYIDLQVWQKSMDLVEEVYKLINLLPKEEQFALANQMRRAVTSIPSNIAEGQARKGTKEFLNFFVYRTRFKGRVANSTTYMRKTKLLNNKAN